MRALVTGASGFIGSHLLIRLEAIGDQVHPVSRTPRPGWHCADVADASAIAELVRNTEPDVIFHLASMVTGARDPNMVAPTVRANLASAINILTAVAGTGTKVVLAGSIEESGAGDSPYIAAKRAATAYARMFHRLWHTDVAVLRVAMTYGPAQPDHTKLVPYVIGSLLRGESPELTSGTREVDWIFIDDVVDAFVAAAHADAAGQVLDIGTGVQTSVRDTVELIAALVGTRSRPRFGAIPTRPMDAPQLADPSSAARVLSWHPRTDLAEGLRRTVAWYAENL